MSAGVWFWLIYVILAIFGGYLGWSSGDKRFGGACLVILVLIGLLGWGLFGPPIR